MTNSEKAAIYNRLNELINDYEQNDVQYSIDDIYDNMARYTMYGIYGILLKIRDNWEELISEE